MSKFFNENKHALLSLGFAFHGKIPKVACDPEKTLLRVLPAFFCDRKLFRMLLAWLNIVSDLLHVERLSSLAEALPSELKKVLLVLSLKLLKRDRRWKIVKTHLNAEIDDKPLEVPAEFRDPYLISKYGIDEEFQTIKVKVARILPEDEKKILSLQGILRANGWLRLRALIGPNFRADVAYLYISGQATGPAETARVLQCARDTAYRNWRALEEADVRKMVTLR
ncbi:MAG: hypothetical protein HY537_14990 [Deltaproteobacteria bacterium]|nr:hypothetical protein [Deltaproteobacteria bacterium]